MAAEHISSATKGCGASSGSSSSVEVTASIASTATARGADGISASSLLCHLLQGNLSLLHAARYAYGLSGIGVGSVSGPTPSQDPDSNLDLSSSCGGLAGKPSIVMEAICRLKADCGGMEEGGPVGQLLRLVDAQVQVGA